MVVSGSPKRWAWWHIIPQLAVYTTYIPLIGEPETTIDFVVKTPPDSGPKLVTTVQVLSCKRPPFWCKMGLGNGEFALYFESDVVGVLS